MDSFVIAIILGIVEGITEFLPISSTGHLILVNEVLSGFSGSFSHMFDVVIQLGAILSVVVYFWHRLNPWSGHKSVIERRGVWSLWQKVIVGVIPALLIGALVGEYIQELLFNPTTVAVALVVGGIILIIIEKQNKVSVINDVADLSYKKAFLIGLIQCLSMIPGTSRSASTIIGGMLLGASRSAAAEFSFFLAIPTMVAASSYSLLKNATGLSSTEWQLLAVGFVVSFFVAWAVIAAFMKYIQRRDFIPFGYYRIIVGLAILYFVVWR